MKASTKDKARSSIKRKAWSIPEARQLLGGFSHQTAYNEINSGRLKSFKVGNRRFISDEALNAYIRDREAESEAAA